MKRNALPREAQARIDALLSERFRIGTDEMAADIRGVSLAEYDLHLSKDGSTYEYRDPDEKPVTPEAPKPKKKKTQTPSR